MDEKHFEKPESREEIEAIIAMRDMAAREAILEKASKTAQANISPVTELLAEKFDDRQLRLIDNCQVYAKGNPAGLPGHNLMIIISELTDLIVELVHK